MTQKATNAQDKLFPHSRAFRHVPFTISTVRFASWTNQIERETLCVDLAFNTKQIPKIIQSPIGVWYRCCSGVLTPLLIWFEGGMTGVLWRLVPEMEAWQLFLVEGVQGFWQICGARTSFMLFLHSASLVAVTLLL